MNRLREKTTATLLIAIFMISAFALPMVNAGYEDSIIKAADRLVGLQELDGGWVWEVSNPPPSSYNTYGVTALGMMDAYRVIGTSSYYDAALATANHLKTLDRSTDPAVRIQTFDYRFLVEFSALSEDPSYEAHAINQWSVAQVASPFYQPGNQEDIYTNFWAGTYGDGFAAWQAADLGLATLAMGDTVYATDMAVVLANHLGDIEAGDECRFIGWGHALELFHAVSPTTYATQISSIITLLEDSQEDGGHWLSGQPEGIAQDTAYAAMGLAAVGRSDSANKGTSWLVFAQDISGGWVEAGKEYTETDSEALQALCCVMTSQSVMMSAESGSYELTVDTEGEGDVVPLGQAVCYSGEVVTLTAIPDSNWHFDHWTGQVDVQAATTTVTMLENEAVTVTFVLDVVSLSVSPMGVDFGTVIMGEVSDKRIVTVTNEGNVLVEIDAEVIPDAEFFDTYLKIDDPQLGYGSVDYWSGFNKLIDVGSSMPLDLYLDLTLCREVGAREGTLVFWAEMPG